MHKFEHEWVGSRNRPGTVPGPSRNRPGTVPEPSRNRPGTALEPWDRAYWPPRPKLHFGKIENSEKTRQHLATIQNSATFILPREGLEGKIRKDQTPSQCLAVKKILSFSTLKHSPGKSKRENRENNEHLVPRTFTPNKQNLEIMT